MTSSDVGDRLEKLKHSIEGKLRQANELEELADERCKQELDLRSSKFKPSYLPQLNLQLANLQLQIALSREKLDNEAKKGEHYDIENGKLEDRARVLKESYQKLQFEKNKCLLHLEVKAKLYRQSMVQSFERLAMAKNDLSSTKQEIHYLDTVHDLKSLLDSLEAIANVKREEAKMINQNINFIKQARKIN